MTRAPRTPENTRSERDRPQAVGDQRAMNTWTRTALLNKTLAGILAMTAMLGCVTSGAFSQETGLLEKSKTPTLDPTRSWIVPAPCRLPAKLTARFKPFASVVCIDFTGDGQLDFIALAKRSPKADSDLEGTEWWIASNGQVIRRAPVYSSDHAYRWFQKLDRDPVPTIISAQGYSDGIDYTVQKLDLKTGKLKRLFYFEPVLVEADGHQFHGYPWDVSRLQTMVRNGDVLLRVEIRPRNTFDDESNDNQGNQQQCIPMLFFDGTSTQHEVAARKQSGQGQWVLLDTIVQRTKAKTKHRTTSSGACNPNE
jgi:hypothetical protein